MKHLKRIVLFSLYISQNRNYEGERIEKEKLRERNRENLFLVRMPLQEIVKVFYKSTNIGNT